jgi:hypothetical protein
MRNQVVSVLAAVAVCLAIGVGWFAADTGARAGTTVAENEAAVLRGGACLFGQSYDCPKGPNPDKSTPPRNCCAETVYVSATGGTKYDFTQNAYCGGGPDYCAVYNKNNPPKCGTGKDL